MKTQAQFKECGTAIVAGSLRPGEIAGIAITLILLVLVIVVVILVLVFRLKPLLLRGKGNFKKPVIRIQKHFLSERDFCYSTNYSFLKTFYFDLLA
jgi:voltage-gated potassium channel Kch